MSVRILEGDALTVLRTLPDQSVQCCVTSPPYFGLRDYGVAGQLGLEKTPQLYVDAMVGVFSEVKRVLRDDGTLWLNIGDSYAGSGRGGNPPDSPHQKQRTNRGSVLPAGLHESARQGGAVGRAWVKPPPGYKQSLHPRTGIASCFALYAGREEMSDAPFQKEFEAIAESLEMSGTLDKATEQRDQELLADPEWSTEKYIHVHTLVEAFAVGIISADAWHWGYKLPPDFEGVVNWMAFNIQSMWPKDVIPKLSLNQIKAFFNLWAYEHPSFRKWNETKPGAPMVGVVSRYSSTPDERDFIDLGALIHNAVLHIREKRRRDEEFDRKFDAEHPEFREEQSA